MLFDIPHQEPDHDHGYHERRHHPHQQDRKLRPGKIKPKLHDLEQAGSQHHRNRQEKGEFRRHRSGYPDQQRTNNGRPGSGRARKYRRQKLKHPDHKSRLERDLLELRNLRRHIPVPVLDHDKSNTEHDQRHRNTGRIVEQRVKHVVERQPDHRRRDTCYQDLEPEHENIGPDHRFLLEPERKDLVPEQQHYRQDRPQLDHHQKHLPELFRHIQLHEFIQKDHVPRTADGQPLRDTLHNTK